MMKLTLRMRMTALVGLIVAAIAVVLTAASISGANNYFVDNDKKQEMEKQILNGEEVGKEYSGISAIVTVTEAQKKFSNQSIVVMLIIVAVGIAAAYIIVGRALKPLSELSETIREINERNLSQRIEVPHTKDEVGSISASFNSMMDRLDASFARQKRFTANAAHELKTPLATIKASLQVLHMDENPTIEDYHINAEATKHSTERLIRVVDDLLRLAVEDNSHFYDDISLQSIFEEISAELRPLAETNKVTIEARRTDCRLRGNQTLLYRAVFNVVENAVKYNKQGGKVELSAIDEGGSILLTIRDQGMGIAEEEMNHIFEPFYRVDKSRSREISGSGLGLSIVKTIIDKHNGTIEVKSIKGSGTEVSIRFSQIQWSSS